MSETLENLDTIRDYAEMVRQYRTATGSPAAWELAGHVLMLLDERREFLAVRAELSALRAALDAVAEALRPALEAEAGATAGEWTYHPDDPNYSNAPHMVWGPNGPGHGAVAQTCSPGMMPYPGGRQAADARLIAASVNAVRALLALPAVRAALEGVRDA